MRWNLYVNKKVHIYKYICIPPATANSTTKSNKAKLIQKNFAKCFLLPKKKQQKDTIWIETKCRFSAELVSHIRTVGLNLHFHFVIVLKSLVVVARRSGGPYYAEVPIRKWKYPEYPLYVIRYTPCVL